MDPRIINNAPFKIPEEARFIVAARVGSESHGTYIPKEDGGIDDVDILGAIMPPVSRIIGLEGWEHWVQMIDELDLTFYSLRKLVSLWLKSNPNVLGLLWMRDQDILITSATFEMFRSIRRVFVCRTIADSFGGYAYSHLRDIHKNRHEGYMGQKRQVLVEKFGYDVKNAAHLIRLLRMGIEFLQEGELHVYRTNDAEELKSIKRGEWTLEQVQTEGAILFEKLEKEKNRSRLPLKPVRGLVDQVLIEATHGWIMEGMV